MNAPRSFSLLTLVILTVLAVQACVPITNITATATIAPEITTPAEPPSPNPTQASPTSFTVPTQPSTITPTAEVVTEMVLNGQLAYIFEGNVWRYILATGESIQVTTQVWDGHYTNYFDPQFSPDGRYLAYSKHPDNRSYISDLVDGTVIEITSYGEFFGWTGHGNDFFAGISKEKWVTDQMVNTFKFYRYDLANLDSPEFLASLSEQRRSPLSISSDGQWASLNMDRGCPYPECRFDKLWNLSTAKEITPPADFTAGHIDFSPDSKKLALSARYSDWYKESPLFVANIDMSALTPIVSQPQTRVGYVFWSPDGQWLAYQAIEFDSSNVMSDGQYVIERRVMLVRPDGSDLTRVAGESANLVGWSPDGSHLLYWQYRSEPPIFTVYEIKTGLKQALPLIVNGPRSEVHDWGNLQ
ncbi:MAG TPA: hypothetical protein VLR89_01460 [Anaerolineaceae bacterium]|nr:hypothetical protein [Anaerolineaceae bacterium]